MGTGGGESYCVGTHTRMDFGLAVSSIKKSLFYQPEMFASSDFGFLTFGLLPTTTHIVYSNSDGFVIVC